jgi:hypothetical protein
MNDGI